MVDTTNPSWHLSVWASHGTLYGEEKYWKELSNIEPPHALESDDTPTLKPFMGKEYAEQLNHNKKNFPYLVPETGEVKEEVWRLLDIGDLDNELIKQHYIDANGDRLSDYQTVWDWKPQCSHNHKLWQDPIKSEYFMSFMPFSAKHLNEFISFLSLGGIPSRKDLGLEFRNDKKPGLDAIEEYATNKYYWDDREWNRFFFPDRNSETGQKLTEEG